MPSSTRLTVTPNNAAAVIGIFVGGLFAIYVVAYVWVYGFIPDLISSVVYRFKYPTS
jgi:hypothetical protein